MEENQILNSKHYDCTCTHPKPTDLLGVKLCLNCMKPLPNQGLMSSKFKSKEDELAFFSNQWHCEHEYIAQDLNWKSCTKCGNIKPTRDFR
jgi:hypothetical protein